MPTIVPDRGDNPERKFFYLQNEEPVKRRKRISQFAYQEVLKARKPGTKDPFYDGQKRLGEWDPERY